MALVIMLADGWDGGPSTGLKSGFFLTLMGAALPLAGFLHLVLGYSLGLR